MQEDSAATVHTLSQRNQKQPKIRRVEMDRSLILIGVYATSKISSQGERSLLCQSNVRDTVKSAAKQQSDQIPYPSPHYLRFCFYTLWYIQQSQNHTTQQENTYPANHNLLFGQFLMLPKFWITTRFLGISLHKRRTISCAFVCHFLTIEVKSNAIIIIMMMIKWCQWNVFQF